MEFKRRFSNPGCLVGRNCNSWTEEKMVGKGSFGDVYQCRADDGFVFVAKVAPLSDSERVSHLEQEINMLRSLEHKNIVRYLGTDKDKRRLYLFLEFMPNGSLSSLLKKRMLEASKVSKYTRQILEGLKYLHNRNVMHRGIKCPNILVDARGNVKLADFGLAMCTEKNAAKSSIGTLRWMAPEVFNSNDKESYGFPADIWSVGCTVLEMITGEKPYSGLPEEKVELALSKGKPPRVPKYLPEDAQKFIIRCCQKDPNARPSVTSLLNDPFVKKPEK